MGPRISTTPHLPGEGLLLNGDVHLEDWSMEISPFLVHSMIPLFWLQSIQNLREYEKGFMERAVLDTTWGQFASFLNDLCSVYSL